MNLRRAILLNLLLIFAAESHAADKFWGDASGGTFSDPTNWQGGSAAGEHDAAHFSHTRSLPASYTVDFTGDAINQALIITHDNVTFDLNFNTYTPAAIVIGTVPGHPVLGPSGRLTIINGFIQRGFSGNWKIGAVAGASGSLTVSTNAQLASDIGLDPIIHVGDLGNGTLTVNNGGDILANKIHIGNSAGVTGTATITGAGSQLLAHEEFIIGNQGRGFLNIAAGGYVEVDDGFFSVGGFGHGTVNITSGGRLSTESAVIGVEMGSVGEVTVDGVDSMWTNSGLIFVSSFGPGTGTLTVANGGTVSAQSGLMVRLLGTLRGDGQIIGNVSNIGVVAPGLSSGALHVMGNFTQGVNGKLNIELGGVTSDTQHDFLDVTGIASLNGELQLALIDGFVPTMQQTFTVLAANSIAGSFSNITSGQRLDTVDGIGSFLVHYGAGSLFNPTQIVLSDFLTMLPPGDLNIDGFVGQDDLSILLGHWGQNVTPGNRLMGDPSGDGFVGQDDLNPVLGGWGQGTPPTLAATNPVPEPQTLLHVTIAIALIPFCRSIRQRKFSTKGLAVQLHPRLT